MRPSVIAHRDGLGPAAHDLLARLVSPLTGLQRTLAVPLRDDGYPRVVVVTGQLTSVHRLLGLDEPLQYHIGGYGLHVEEALMRVLGESVERYAHMICGTDRTRAVERGTLAEMRARHGHGGVLAVDALRFFTAEQLARPGFPVQPWRPDADLGWVRAENVATGGPLWLPAQLAIVGYLRPRPAEGRAPEPWLVPAITTGTAAHTVPVRALRSALFELVQGHVATGHWYSDHAAPAIVPDEARTPALRRLLERDMPRHRCRIRFHRLGGDGFGLHVVAGVLESLAEGEVPAVALGLGVDTRLETAMYKAYLETSAMPYLAILNLAKEGRIDDARALARTGIDNLDDNVFLYALPENRKAIDERFPPDLRVAASDLPSDRSRDADPGLELRELTRRILARGATLALLDLTSPEIADLGFQVYRFYSPDLLPFGLPSYPPAAHPAFAEFGGLTHDRPHPYA